MDLSAGVHHRFPLPFLAVRSLPSALTPVKERISRGVMRRRPSLDILPSVPPPSPFLPSSVLAVTSARAPGLPAGKRGRTAESFRHNIFYRWEPYIITVSDEKRAPLSASNRPSRRDPFIPDSTGFYHGPPLCACLQSCLVVCLPSADGSVNIFAMFFSPSYTWYHG